MPHIDFSEFTKLLLKIYNKQKNGLLQFYEAGFITAIKLQQRPAKSIIKNGVRRLTFGRKWLKDGVRWQWDCEKGKGRKAFVLQQGHAKSIIKNGVRRLLYGRKWLKNGVGWRWDCGKGKGWKGQAATQRVTA